GWNILDPLLERGELPQFRNLMESGVSGPIQSLSPPFSPRIWGSISTGLVPEKHNILDFLKASYTRFKAKPIWKIIEEAGYRIGVYAWLSTWPPFPLNGFVVPGWLAKSDAAYPDELSFINEMKNAARSGGQASNWKLIRCMIRSIRYGVRVSTLTRIGLFAVSSKLPGRDYKEVYRDAQFLKMDLDQDLFLALASRFKVEAAFYYIQIIDPLSHSFWKYMEPDGFEVAPDQKERYDEIIRDGYRAVDEKIGELMAHIHSDTPVLIVSDHGLESGAKIKDSMFMFNMRAETVLQKIGMDREVTGFHKGVDVFFSVNEGCSRPEDRVFEELERKLSSFRLADASIPIFSIQAIKRSGGNESLVSANPTKDLYHFLKEGGEKGKEAEVLYEVGVCRIGELIQTKEASGIHSLEGILFMQGPGFKQGERIEEASVLDITPSILYLMDLPVGKDMDGRILTEAMKPEFTAQRQPRWVAGYPKEEGEAAAPSTNGEEGDNEVIDRLKTLGYIF
ncbi:MAG: alkaline phosphatase family protein, partial [Planctomycetes bacterium]|nr:alkaline phosphatase family protein [Planctomycetota bacterium]